MSAGLVVHVPHASIIIPEEYLEGFLISEERLKQEISWSTDAYTDELYDVGYGIYVKAKYSRLVCDVERFRDDELEINAKKGNGLHYTHTLRGLPLREPNPRTREQVLTQIYDPHHADLTHTVGQVLNKHDFCLIIDGHSFPDDPYVGLDLPDFCIGTDSYHTPEPIAAEAYNILSSLGYTVEYNRPYAGAIVPMSYYGKEKRVLSLMMEVNRRLYLNAGTMDKSSGFMKIKDICGQVVNKLFSKAQLMP